MSVRLKAGEFAFEEAAANAEAIDRNSIAKKFFNGVLVGIAIGFAVFAVGDEEDDFAAVAATILEELRGFIDRVVESLGGFFANDRSRRSDWWSADAGDGLAINCGAGKGAAGSGRSGVGAIGVKASAVEFGEELVLVACKTLARMKIAVETAYKGFVIAAEHGHDS